MDDAELRHRIDELVEEEHRLERAHVGKPLSAGRRATGRAGSTRAR